MVRSKIYRLKLVEELIWLYCFCKKEINNKKKEKKKVYVFIDIILCLVWLGFECKNIIVNELKVDFCVRSYYYFFGLDN